MESLDDRQSVPIVVSDGFLSFFFLLSSLFFLCIRHVMIMEAKEPSLTPEIAASILMEEKVCQLGEKFGFMVGIHLEVPRKDEHITEGTMMRVTLHKESLNAGLRIPMVPAMANLLRWYNLCSVQLVSNA